MLCDKFGLYWPNVSGQTYKKFTTKLIMTLRTTDNRQFDQEASFEASTQKGLKGRIFQSETITWVKVGLSYQILILTYNSSKKIISLL